MGKFAGDHEPIPGVQFDGARRRKETGAVDLVERIVLGSFTVTLRLFDRAATLTREFQHLIGLHSAHLGTEWLSRIIVGMGWGCQRLGGRREVIEAHATRQVVGHSTKPLVSSG